MHCQRITGPRQKIKHWVSMSPSPNHPQNKLPLCPFCITNSLGWIAIPRLPKELVHIYWGKASLLEWLAKNKNYNHTSRQKLLNKQPPDYFGLKLLAVASPLLNFADTFHVGCSQNSSLIRKPHCSTWYASRLHQLAYAVLRSLAVYIGLPAHPFIR
jgi:hypothetical protein